MEKLSDGQRRVALSHLVRHGASRRQFLATTTLLAALLAGPQRLLAAGEPYKVGLLIALTGPQATGGSRELDPVLFAAKQINDAGGIDGHPIEVIVEDNQTSAQVGVTRLNKLIYEDEVSVIIGDVGSAAMAYSPILAKAGVPFVFNGATLTVTEHGNPWMFRDIPSDRYVAIQMLTYIKEVLGKSRVALLTETSAYGEGAGLLFNEYSERDDLAVEIVAHEKYQINDVDLTPHVTKIKGEEPEVLIIWGASAAGAVALRNAKSVGLDIPTIAAVGMIQPGVLDAAGPAAEGLIAGAYGMVPGEDIQQVAAATETLKSFVRDFSAAHPNREISFWELMSYDAMLIVAEAFRRAGSGDRTAVRDAIQSIEGLEGTLGIQSFSVDNHDGVEQDAIVVMQYEGGKWHRRWPL